MSETHSSDSKRHREVVLAGLRYAYALTHHLQDAEDVAQEAALRVFRKKGQLCDKPYLLTAIRNLYCNLCRRRGIVAFEPLNDETAVGCQSQSAIENRLDIELMLGYLNDTQREVLYLHYVESLTAAEIASITKRPRATVLSQLSRARQKLQMLFAQGTSEEDTQRENRVV